MKNNPNNPGKSGSEIARRAVMAVLLMLSAFFFFAWPSQAADQPKAAQKAPRFFWKFGTMAPDGVGYSNQINTYVMPLVTSVSRGDIKVKVYWGGSMGDDQDIMRKMRFGYLNGAGLSGQGVTYLCPETSVLSLPFLFNDYEEVDAVVKQLGYRFENYMTKSNVFLFSWLDQDFDQIYSNRPITRLSDFSRMRFLTWYGTLEEEVLKTLGTKPVPVSGTLIAPAIKQGQADAVISPAIFIVGSQMFTELKYASTIKIRYSPAMVVIRQEDWQSLPQEYVKKYYEFRASVRERMLQDVRRNNKRFFAAITKYGIVETRMSEKDIEEVRKSVTPLWRKLAGRLYPADLLDELLADLAKYRASRPS